MQIFLKIKMGGRAHERRIDGKFRERRLAWKKGNDRGTSLYHFPKWVPPGYLAFTSYYAYNDLIDSDAVFWSYYTRFKTNKAKNM